MVEKKEKEKGSLSDEQIARLVQAVMKLGPEAAARVRKAVKSAAKMLWQIV